MRNPKKYKKDKWFLTAIFFILKFSTLCSQNGLIINDKNILSEKIDLNPYLYIKSQNAGEHVLLKNVINELPVNKSFEFEFTISNKTNDSILRIIQFQQRYITASFSVFSVVEEQPYSTRSNFLQVCLAPNEVKKISVLIHELNRAEEKKLDLVLMSAEYKENATNGIYITQAFFLGLFAFLILYNLIVFFITSWRLYLKYAVYIFFALFYFLYYFGLLQSVFPSVNDVSVNLVYTWYSLIFISYFVFLNDFGDYKNQAPKAYLLLNCGIVFKALETIINTVLHLIGVDFIYSGVYIKTIIALEIILMIFILFYIFSNKSLRGKIVIIASCFLILGGIVEQTKMFSGLDNAFFMECCVTAELLIFSTGLGYTTKLYYEEKRKAELRYIEQLVANENFHKENNQQLELLVKERTEELRREKLLVEKKNSENELLLAEIHHRVKNNLQLVSSLLNLQEKSIEDGAAKQAILLGKERIRSMELVHKMLYHANSYSGIEMKDYVNKLSEGLMQSFGVNRNEMELDLNFEQIVLNVDTAIPVGLILNELIINVLKHAKIDSQKLVLRIKLFKKEKDGLVLHVSDNGEGKLSEVQSSNSFGLRIIKSLVRQLNGDLVLNDEKGLYYTINLKLVN